MLFIQKYFVLVFYLFWFVTVEPKFLKESPKLLKWDCNKNATIIQVNIWANPEPVIEWDIDGKTYFEGKTVEEYTSTNVVSEVCMSDKLC